MPPPQHTIVVGSQNWQHQASAAMAARQRVRLVITGPDGEGLVKRLAKRGLTVPKVGVGSDKGAGVDGGVLRVVTIEYLVLGTILALALIVGVSAVYTAEVRQRTTGGRTSPHTELDLIPRN